MNNVADEFVKIDGLTDKYNRIDSNFTIDALKRNLKKKMKMSMLG